MGNSGARDGLAFDCGLFSLWVEVLEGELIDLPVLGRYAMLEGIEGVVGVLIGIGGGGDLFGTER